MKRIDFYAHVCNHYAPAKQSDSDAKNPLCLALFIVYQFFLLLFFHRSHDRYNAPSFRVLSSVLILMKFLREREINGCIFEGNPFLGENISSVSICEQEVT